jgi:hypothetical protein
MWEVKETSPSGELQHGHAVVGVTPVPLTDAPAKFKRGILLRAPGPNDLTPNTDVVYVGRKCVTADSNAGTGGMPILPGSALELPVEDPSQVFVVSLSPGQDLAWMGV